MAAMRAASAAASPFLTAGSARPSRAPSVGQSGASRVSHQAATSADLVRVSTLASSRTYRSRSGVSRAREAGSAETRVSVESGCRSGRPARSRTARASSIAACMTATPARTSSSPARSAGGSGKGAQ